ncbi:hypothetical protein BDW59DRAFT_182332 [Aspergillus cavernicola]|uniref:N,N-dimethylformamidase beta subunit-like C-terminal domain-containing protein n=1 Tax=Aspergillus cavernicola TaxID=176166 RepID=A0ABR4HNS6_9EURO
MSTIRPIPPNYPLEIIGYAEPWIVSPGEDVAIKISCTGPSYTYRTVRVITGYESANGPPKQSEVVEGIPSGTRPGRYQVAHPGSYAVCADIGFRTELHTGLRLGFFVQPWLVECDHPQALVSVLDGEGTGVAVVLSPHGEVEVWVGRNKQHIRSGFYPLKQRWCNCILEVDGTALRLEIEPQHRGTEPASGKTMVSAVLDEAIVFGGKKTELLMAACRGDDGLPTHMFNGRLASVVVTALTKAEPQILAQYDFSIEIPSDSVYDVSGNDRAGTLVNGPSRAMKGPDWQATETDWTKAASGYGAIHFHEDDLDDAKWETDFLIRIPEEARSGVYGVEIVGEWPEGNASDTVVFFIRPTPESTQKLGAKTAMIMSTITYLAYANEHQFDADSPARVEVPDGFDSLTFHKDETFHKQDRRRDLGLSCYDVHRDRTGVIYSSSKRPLLNCRPGYVNWTGHRPRELSADLLMVGFLERLSIPYDIVTDHDLHTIGPAALAAYTTVITGCHPEYQTLSSYTAYESFVQAGGNMMYLGGNGFYWTAAISNKIPHRIEIRRGNQGVRTSYMEPGERHFSLTGTVGGLWRDAGKAANYLVGMGCCGEGVGPGVPYRQTPSVRTKHPDLAAWVFDGIPDSNELLIGTNALGCFGGGASADEIDRVDFQYGSPSNIVILASSPGHSDRFGLFPEDVGFPMIKTLGTQTDLVRSDMVFYRTSGGGSVFGVGSISWFGALGWDNYGNDIARVTGNVLRRFVGGS